MVLKIYLLLCLMNFLSTESFLLPNSTEPESYILIITTRVPVATSRFTGNLVLALRVLENTNEIFLHSRGHTFNSWSLFEQPDNLQLENILIERVNDEVIRITSEEELKAGTEYDLLIDYHGSLLFLASDGFFRSHYVVNDNGNDVYT